MSPTVFWLVFIACLCALRSGECFEAKRFFGVGQRIDGDQLLVKDVRHSHPAGADELPEVEFQYDIVEPITCVEIISDDVSVKKNDNIFKKKISYFIIEYFYL